MLPLAIAAAGAKLRAFMEVLMAYSLRRLALAAASFSLIAPLALAGTPLIVHVDAIDATGKIAPDAAICIPDGKGKSTDGKNIRPGIDWTAGPKATQSYAILVTDPDVPADISVAYKADHQIAANALRQTFYHWAQFNIPAGTTSLKGGDAALAGISGANQVGPSKDKLGYGGPCPPFNDARLHHYHFTVYALDTMLELEEGASAADVAAAMKGHVLSRGQQIGTFTNAPALLKQ